MELKQRFIDIYSIRTHYWYAGDEQDSRQPRRTVVLLHGGGIDNASLSWGLLMPELGEKLRVFAPDFPGYGDSDSSELPYGVAFYGVFLAAFLDALRIDRASLVGLSMGGSAALDYTLKYPERVDKLALVDSYGLQRTVAFHKLSYLLVHTPGMAALSWLMMRSRPMIRYTLSALLKRPGAITPELVELVYQAARQPGAGSAWSAFQKEEMLWDGARTCFMEQLGEIRAPTLIVHGSRDSAVPPACAREAHERIRGSRLEWMDGCGHWPQRDDPPAFNRVLLDFLKD